MHLEHPVMGELSCSSEECRLLEQAGVRLVWFDSLGAKSSSILVRCTLIDPGIAAMQPSYPISSELKAALRSIGAREICRAAAKAKCIIITHYHYDHHMLPRDPDLDYNLYKGKTIIAKNPNKYINESQWRRARLFLEQLLESLGGQVDPYTSPVEEEFRDPVDDLREALSRSFGDYDERRRELLEKGRNWFKKLARLWAKGPWVKESISVEDTTIIFNDEVEFECCGARFKLLGPWFHGIEYDRTGWVTPVLIECHGYRILYTSDLMGPIIEDYAYTIVELKPDIIIADGPPTYLFPYMFNRINLERAVNNMVYILENCSSLKLVVYDHHLLRERLWRKRTLKVFEASKRLGVSVLTAAELLGSKPLIDLVSSGDK